MANDDSLGPLLRHLAEGAAVTEPTAFPRGTLLPDGRLDLCKQDVGPDGARAVASALRDNRFVTSLLLGDDHLENAGAAAVADLVRENDTVTTVFVGCNLIDRRGAASLASAIEGHPTLRGLWLKRNPLGADGGQLVARAIPRCPSLRVLDLAQTGIGAALPMLAEAVASHASLRRVYLSGNDLGPDHVAALALLLGPGSPVRALYLSANRLGDEGIARLAPALASNRDLQVLSLGSNGLTSAGAALLHEALQEHPSLQALDLGRSASTSVLGVSDNRIDVDVRRALDALFSGRASAAVDEDLLAIRSVYRVPAGAGARLPTEGSEQSAVGSRPTWTVRRPAPVTQVVAPPPTTPPPSVDELDACARTLAALRQHPELAASKGAPFLAVRAEANRLVAAIQRQTHDAKRARGRQAGRAARERRRTHDRALLEATEIRASRRGETLAPVAARQLGKPRICYVCKARHAQVHPFYDALCPACADANVAKRGQAADLAGHRALVTGGRVKIGYRIVLSLLRAGADVVVATRFPWDAAHRFAAEPDFDAFRQRLRIHGLDLRDLPAVERFADALAGAPYLDILVNNAAQTVRRPPAYYEHLLAAEASGNAGLPAPASQLVARELHHAASAAVLSQLPLLAGDALRDERAFPPGLLTRDGQQLDLRDRNSWGLAIGEIDRVELLEVHHVNAFAPFLLLERLLPLLRRSPHDARFVVNVSAMEGKFEYAGKQPTHPHTNMAKAALNMLTRTAGPGLAAEGIYMTSVDTGWITNEHPFPIAETMRVRHGFAPPLDEQDGAARVLDPVYAALNGAPPLHSVFLKDYRPASW
jgi:NAD(P)-dependent dehydrogenase (short-subunit alcohol dehydrogenase family)